MTNCEYQELVEFLGRKFDEVDRRFDSVEAKLVMHDRRFDSVEATLAEHDERFREILGHFDALYHRLELLQDEYHAILQALRRIETLLADERGRRETLERSVEELKHRMATLQARVEELEQQIRDG